MPVENEEGVLAPGDQTHGDAGGSEGIGLRFQFQTALRLTDAYDTGVVEDQRTDATRTRSRAPTSGQCASAAVTSCVPDTHSP